MKKPTLVIVKNPNTKNEVFLEESTNASYLRNVLLWYKIKDKNNTYIIKEKTR